MSVQDDFIQQHAPNGELTAEQAAQLLELGEGDTVSAASASTETGSQPEATAATESEKTGDPQAGAATTGVSDAELNADNAVILAKDGKHTIGYDKLVEAREAERAWRDKATAAQGELDELRAQAKQRADAGDAPTATDNQVAAASAAIEAGVDPAIFGDFSEEDIAKGVQTLIRQTVPAIVEAQVKQALLPQQQKQEADLLESHRNAIYEKHPDLDSILESKELQDWLSKQPSFIQAGYKTVLEAGTAPEVIELFDTYKAATGKGQAAEPASVTDVKAAAQAAIAKAQTSVPNSLSDFPGGRVGPASPFEAIANLPPDQQIDAVSRLSSDDRERWLNSQI
jgi:hypothetical protein